MSNDAALYSNHHPHVLDPERTREQWPIGARNIRREPVLGLAPGRLRCLRAICELFIEKGWPPTLREVGARMGFKSHFAAHDHIAALQRQGALHERTSEEHQRARNFMPTKLGWLAAGFTPPSDAGEAPSSAKPARVFIHPSTCERCGRVYFGDLGAMYHGYGLCWR